MSLIDSHLSYLRFINRRRDTIKHRRDILNAFHRSILPRALTAASRNDVLAYVGRDSLAPASRRSYLAHLRGFYRWAVDEELMVTDPTRKIPTPALSPGTPRPLAQEAVEGAIMCANPRMRAWILLMYLAGLRSIEVAHLRPGDVLFDPYPMLHLRVTKGGRPATVPAHPRVLHALSVMPVVDDAWWDVVPDTVSKLVAQHLREVGIDATGHQLRHTFATVMYEASGHDVLTTQRLLRHRNVSSTMIYADVAPTRPAQVVADVP